jgi:hypothetical protein
MPAVSADRAVEINQGMFLGCKVDDVGARLGHVIQGAPCGWGAAIHLVSGKQVHVNEEDTERIMNGIEPFAEHFFFPSLKNFFPAIH